MPRLTASSASSRGVQVLDFPICRLWFFTRERHDLHELLQGEGGWRFWALCISQKGFDGLTQEFWLTCRFDGLQTELSRSPTITPPSHRFIIHVLVLGYLRIAQGNRI